MKPIAKATVKKDSKSIKSPLIIGYLLKSFGNTKLMTKEKSNQFLDSFLKIPFLIDNKTHF